MATLTRPYRELLELAEAVTGERPWGLRLETINHRDILDHEDELVKVLDAAICSTLLDKSGLRSLFDAPAGEQLRHATPGARLPAHLTGAGVP